MCAIKIDAKMNSCPLGGGASNSSLSQPGVQFVVSVSSHAFFWVIDVLVSEIMPKFNALPSGAMRVGLIG